MTAPNFVERPAFVEWQNYIKGLINTRHTLYNQTGNVYFWIWNYNGKNLGIMLGNKISFYILKNKEYFLFSTACQVSFNDFFNVISSEDQDFFIFNLDILR